MDSETVQFGEIRRPVNHKSHNYDDYASRVVCVTTTVLRMRVRFKILTQISPQSYVSKKKTKCPSSESYMYVLYILVQDTHHNSRKYSSQRRYTTFYSKILEFQTLYTFHVAHFFGNHNGRVSELWTTTDGFSFPSDD